MKALVAGWFSFEWMGATGGDLMVADVVCAWLQEAGCQSDVALAPPFVGGVDWRAVDPASYSHVIFACGPFGNGEPVIEFLDRFRGCRLVGINLSMLESLETWNPFDLLLERDSSRGGNPDLTFVAAKKLVPVVGKILVHKQQEYGDRGRHDAAHEAIEGLLQSREIAVVPIDTRLDVANEVGLRTAAEVESLIAKMDVVVTTRLHGTVLSLRNGVPVVAVDPIAGGAKIRMQAEVIGWPALLTPETLTGQALQDAFDYCLTAAARAKAMECATQAARIIDGLREQFVAEFTKAPSAGVA